MKTRYLLILLLLMFPVLSIEISGQLKQEQTEMLIYGRNFVFHADRAIPSRGSSIDLTTNVSYVKFTPDLIDSYMPFFGRAYGGVGYGNDSGFHFKGQPEEYKIDRKKNKYQITASVRSENENYRIFLTVTNSGTASMSISSNNRESMNYQGEIRPPAEMKGRKGEKD
ncbi:MAG: DUF4251 domain-containing protein [Methanosarcina sp.]